MLKATPEWARMSEEKREETVNGRRIAYFGEGPVNWCKALGTVLSNDEVVDGKSERGGHPVETRIMKQWFLRMTDYADRLFDGLANLDWPDKVKNAQARYLGKQHGYSLTMNVENPLFDHLLDVYFDVFVPEGESVSMVHVSSHDVLASMLGQDKYTSEDAWFLRPTGLRCRPRAGVVRRDMDRPIPIFMSSNVSHGAVGVGLKGDGTCITAADVKTYGVPATRYEMRDPVFSRQRYWGEPIPMRWQDGKPIPDWPVKLHRDGPQPSHMDQNVMPSWAGSSWYFLRFLDATNDWSFADYGELDRSGPVDLYVGGAEHATGHLLYARFFTMFLHDVGKCPFEEPFKKLVCQGLIKGENNKKMSKRNGDANLDEFLDSKGSDVLRMHILFAGPLEQDWNWKADTSGVERFLKRVGSIKVVPGQQTDEERDILGDAFDQVADHYDNMRHNLAISALMIAVKKLDRKCSHSGLSDLAVALYPIAPTKAHEIWKHLGHEDTPSSRSWPKYKPHRAKDRTMVIVVDGKAVASVMYSEGDAEQAARNWLAGNVSNWSDLRVSGEIAYAKSGS